MITVLHRTKLHLMTVLFEKKIMFSIEWYVKRINIMNATLQAHIALLLLRFKKTQFQICNVNKTNEGRKCSV